MLGLGVSLNRSNVINELGPILAYNVGDRTTSNTVLFYNVPPDINATSTLGYSALTYSVPIPKDDQDTLYDSNNEDQLTYTTTASRLQTLRDSYKIMYNGSVIEGFQLVQRNTTTFPNIADDDMLAGWYNNIYLPYKDNFKQGLYYFGGTSGVGAVFSTDTGLFYDNIDIDEANIKVHLVFGKQITNTYTNLFPTPLESPLVTPTASEFVILPNELLATGLSVPEVAKQYRYNQRYHKYTDYKDEVTATDTISTNDTNKEFRPTNNVCLSQLNKQIVVQVPQHRFNQLPPYQWRSSNPITMVGEITCIGPYGFEPTSGVIYQQFEVQESDSLVTNSQLDTIYGNYSISIRKFIIPQSVLDPLPVASLGRTVAQATYTTNSEDGDGTHKLLYFKIRNLRFKASGYLLSRNTLSTSMTESILVPTIDNNLVTNISSYANLVVSSFNQTSLKTSNQISETAINVSTANLGTMENITPVGLESYNLGDIQTPQQVKYEIYSGDISGDRKYVVVGGLSTTKQIYYRVKCKVFSWWETTADTFLNVQIRLIKQNIFTGAISVLETTTLTPEDMELIVRVTNDFKDTHYRFDISNTDNYSIDSGYTVYVDIKIVPIAVYQSVYDDNLIGFLRFDSETKFEAQNFPLSPSSPPPSYNIPTIPTYNE